MNSRDRQDLMFFVALGLFLLIVVTGIAGLFPRAPMPPKSLYAALEK